MGFFFDWTMRLVGPLLLVFATALISGVIGMYFIYILPAATTFGSIAYWLHACWAMFLAFNVFFNYFHCAFTHPGNPDKFLPSHGMSDSEDEETEDDEEVAARPLIGEAAGISRVNVGGNSAGDGHGEERTGRAVTRGAMQVGYCRKCSEPKPARTHHCHVCDQCIVNMDHHCPWMNNCVGYLNYRYFVLFLMYMFIGCCYAVLITIPQFLALAETPRRRRKPHGHEASSESAVMMTFVLAISVGIAIAVLLGWHIYLILTAQTTIEFYQNQTNRSRARQWGELWSNPFDVGCKGNWQQVFGPKPFLLGLLPSRRAPPPPVVEFFPLEERNTRRESDEGEWTVDSPHSAQHMV
ncbi:unnamed protein product [Sphacelaria rigidula]